MLRVAVLCSDRASGLEHLLVDPNRGRRYELVLCLSTAERVPASEELQTRCVSRIAHPLDRFFRDRDAEVGALEVHREFDRATAQLLRAFQVDLVLLDGYRYGLTEPVLEELPERILAIHCSDLTDLGSDGRPRYLGEHAVYDAIAAGETETRATVHLVVPGELPGRPLLRSWPFPVASVAERVGETGKRTELEAQAEALEEWMLSAASGPLFRRVLELWSLDRLEKRSRSPVPEIDAKGRLVRPEPGREGTSGLVAAGS